MNNIFKKGAIKLNEEFSLTPDPDHGLVLNRIESRMKDETVKQGLKSVKTGNKVAYNHTTNLYFPSVGMALEKFVTLSGNSSKTIEDIIKNSEETMMIVKEFRTKYKNWD